MAISAYVPHFIYSLSLTSLSFHLLFLKKQAEQDRAHLTAQTTILTSLVRQLRSGPVPDIEFERLSRLAKTHEDKTSTAETLKEKVGWGDVFLGREDAAGVAEERETRALNACESCSALRIMR